MTGKPGPVRFPLAPHTQVPPNYPRPPDAPASNTTKIPEEGPRTRAVAVTGLEIR